jgi:hypothetical protein
VAMAALRAQQARMHLGSACVISESPMDAPLRALASDTKNAPIGAVRIRLPLPAALRPSANQTCLPLFSGGIPLATRSRAAPVCQPQSKVTCFQST